LAATLTPANPVICPGNSLSLSVNGQGGTGIITYSWSTGSTGSSVTISPSVNTTYTVLLTDNNSCTLIAATTVSVESAPIVVVNSGSICSGSNFTINPTGASSYTIQGGNAIVSPTTTTNYTVIGSNAGGCLGNVATSTVTVNALPVVSATAQTLCLGNSGVLTATGASSYTWSTGGIASTIVVSPTITTSYTVTGQDDNGCVNTATVNQIVDLCTGIQNRTTNQNTVLIYPNPFIQTLTVEVQTEITHRDAAIEIYNALGQLVYKSVLTNGSNQIDLNNLKAGIYTVFVDTDKHHTFKVIKD